MSKLSLPSKADLIRFLQHVITKLEALDDDCIQEGSASAQAEIEEISGPLEIARRYRPSGAQRYVIEITTKRDKGASISRIEPGTRLY